MSRQVSVAIPDSCLQDKTTQEDKSRKVSEIARAAAIFGVRDVLVYDDGGRRADRRLMITILRYLATPPYLRRRLYQQNRLLKHAGALHPLNIPTHTAPPDPKAVRSGDIREGVILPGRLLDAGLPKPLPYHGREEIGRQVLIRFSEGHPVLSYREVPRERSPRYAGYEARERGRLSSVLSAWDGRTILTSKKGKVPSAGTLAGYAAGGPLLLAFGSTDRGLHDILGAEIKSVQNCRVMNLFPGQCTRTVRLEEALLGSLAILGMCREPAGGT